MLSVKRPQYGHYLLLVFLGLVIIAYENSVNKPSLIILKEVNGGDYLSIILNNE